MQTVHSIQCFICKSRGRGVHGPARSWCSASCEVSTRPSRLSAHRRWSSRASAFTAQAIPNRGVCENPRTLESLEFGSWLQNEFKIRHLKSSFLVRTFCDRDETRTLHPPQVPRIQRIHDSRLAGIGRSHTEHCIHRVLDPKVVEPAADSILV